MRRVSPVSRRAPKGASLGAPGGPRGAPSQEISEGERLRFRLALEEVERHFAERLESCAAVLPKELSKKVDIHPKP